MASRINYVLIDFENVHVSDLSPLAGHPVKVMIFLGSKQTTVPVELAETQQLLMSPVEYVRTTGGAANALDFHIAFAIGQLSTRDPEAFFHVISKDSGFDPLLMNLRKRKLRAYRAPEINEINFLRIAREKQAAAREAAAEIVAEVAVPPTEVALARPDVAVSLIEPSASSLEPIPEVTAIKSPGTDTQPTAVLMPPPSALPQQPAAVGSFLAKANGDLVGAIADNLRGRNGSRPRKLKTLRNTINVLTKHSLAEEALNVLINDLTIRGCITVNDQDVAYHFPAS